MGSGRAAGASPRPTMTRGGTLWRGMKTPDRQNQEPIDVALADCREPLSVREIDARSLRRCPCHFGAEGADTV